MSNNIFRQKSIERITSPEQLNDYIRVSTPSVWMLLLAILVLLTGVCVWGAAGHLDTALPAVAAADDAGVVAYVRAGDAAAIEEGMTVRIAGAEGTVTAVSPTPLSVDESFNEYMRHIGSLQQGEWVCAVTLDVDCAAGVHAAQIIIDSASPMSFVLN